MTAVSAVAFRIHVGRFDRMKQRPETVKQLRADIERHGVEVPIHVLPSGEIIDGHTRWRIAQELGIAETVAYVVVEDQDERELHDLAIRWNAHRRHMTRQERDEWIRQLRAEGKTQQNVADVIGISRRRVGQVEEETEAVEVEVTSTSTPIRDTVSTRVTGEESAERNEIIRAALAGGMTCQEIADQLGVHSTAVSERIRRYKLDQPETPEDGGREALVEQIRDLAAQGFTREQIAKRTGLKPPGVKYRADKHGIDIPADRVVANTRRPDATTAMTNTVQGIADAMFPIQFIELDEVDLGPAEEWLRSLTNSGNQIRTLIRQLDRIQKEQNQ